MQKRMYVCMYVCVCVFDGVFNSSRKSFSLLSSSVRKKVGKKRNLLKRPRVITFTLDRKYVYVSKVSGIL